MGLYSCPEKCCCRDYSLRLCDNLEVKVHQVDPYQCYLVELDQVWFTNVVRTCLGKVIHLGSVFVRVPFSSVEKVTKLEDSWVEDEDDEYFSDMSETYSSNVRDDCSKCAVCGLKLDSLNRSESPNLCLECYRGLMQ